MSLTPYEQTILESIVIASENNPNKPEFPAGDPKFPATPTYQIIVPGFSDVWLKDESQNPTGTHKDRMAWEIVVTYRDMLLAKERGLRDGPIPAMSIISSGSAATAIQQQLAHYQLPNLKVLIDQGVEPKIIRSLKTIGCEVNITELDKKPLTSREILLLTNNPDGFDITSNDALSPTTRFYDMLSYEIINSSPDYCFIPFGTGNLYENALNINRREVTAKRHDPRFVGNAKRLRQCHFMGATSNDPHTKAIKLYSPHLPFAHYDEQWIRLYKNAGYCGAQSGVSIIREEFLDQAIRLAKTNSVEAEPSGIAGLALMLQLAEHLPKDKKMLIENTGKTRYKKEPTDDDR